MNFMEKLRDFLGIHNNRDITPYENRTFEQNIPPSTSDIPTRNFNVFTDPLQMQQFFEQQMNDLLKNFGFSNGFDNFFGSFNMPSIEGNIIDESESNSGDLREQYLKKGYEIPARKEKDNIDKDIDGKINLGDLDSVLGRSKSDVVPFRNNEPSNFFFGQSLSTKTITNGDGSVEIHKTMHDNFGNTETTITKKFGDKEYTIIKKRDKNGKEEVTENFINMNELEKEKLFGKIENVPKIDMKPYDGFPFDKFFK